MKMIDIQLKLPGVIAERIIEDHEISPENQQKMRDFGALVNSGASGRFEKEILLDTKACEELKEHSKYLTVEALFDQNGIFIYFFIYKRLSFVYILIIRTTLFRLR
jgi:hypothetical protein